jgi:hypothetical protein
MTKYVVGRKCDAIEWVFVEADNVVEARIKAQAHDCSYASNTLEFSKYQPNDLWLVKDISGEYKLENPDTNTNTITTSSENTQYSEWDLDYGQQDI